jgi:GNAT superfamily N-acetyltransferase
MLDIVFPVQDELENANTCLRASLNPSKYRQILNEWKIPKLEYFIAIDESSDEVVATSGIYEMSGDLASGWVGWTATHPDHRRKGIGEMMLRRTLDEMKKRDYKLAKLHTVDIDDQKNAHKMYEKVGFQLEKVEPNAEIGHDRLYYELRL